MGIQSWGGASGSSTIVDDFSSRIHKIPLSNKGQFVTRFKQWVAQYVQSRGYKIQVIRCDNGTEIKNFKFDDFLTSISARAEFTSTYSPQSDGVAERANQTVLAIANTMRLAADLPPGSWAELDQTACFIHSMLPCKANPGCVSPHEMIFGHPPDVSFLRIIGSTSYVHKFKPTRNTVLDTRSEKGQLIGYSQDTKGYRILMSLSPLRIVDTMHVTFAESLDNSPSQLLSLPDRGAGHYFAQVPDIPLPLPPRVVEVVEDRDEADDEHIIQEDFEQLAPVLRRQRGATPALHVPIQRDPYPVRNRAPHQVNQVRRIQAVRKVLPNLVKFSDAITDPSIKESMAATINELYKIEAITLVKLLPTDRPIKCVWVHQHKHDADGAYIRTKSRICPQGFRFRPGIEFNPDEVASYAPHVQTLMIGMQMEVQRSMFTSHLDVTNCFQMYSELPPDTRIILKTPDGFNVPAGLCIRALNALQGSPQAGRLWQDKAEKHLIHVLKFSQSKIDPSYYWRWDGECFTQIVRTTDDFRISSDKEATLSEVSSQLMSEWKMSIQINKTWNGMEVIHDRAQNILTISMKRDLEVMLNKYGMSDCKPETTPAVPNSKLMKPLEQDNESAEFPYREAVGELLWFARTGRPDILYAVNQLTKFSHLWGSSHVTAVKRVLRYIKGTLNIKLTFRQSVKPYLLVYADSDFAGEPEGNDLPMCSTSGTILYNHGIGPIFPTVNLEKTLSLSTAEAEYKTYTVASKIIDAVLQFYEEVGFPQDKPVPIYNDNQAAIAMSKQSFSTSATRHMKLRFHYIREKIQDGSIRVEYLETGRMIADMMTKALGRVLFERFRNMLMSGQDEDGNIL
jgi:hypothetical protein